MNRMRLSRFVPLLFAVLLLVPAGCLFAPDEAGTGERPANLRPSVRITGGVIAADPVGAGHEVSFSWSGRDVDGAIDSYQWAVDDTLGDGAWHHTTGSTTRFNVEAVPPTAGAASTLAGWHAFYVRAVDNERTASKPDIRYFNTRTIAPTSRITFPARLGPLAQLPRNFLLQWEGEDLDSSRPDGKPLAYEYKLVRVGRMPDQDQAYVDSLRNGQNLLDSLGVGSGREWIRVSRTTTQLTLRSLAVGGLFAFGVRAVDEAGATEPSLENYRNYLAFAVTGIQPQPWVFVREPSLGVWEFPRDGSVWELSVPSGVPLRFTWTGEASFYGSRPGNVNYALDIPDPQDDALSDPNGIGGWIGWGLWKGTQSPISFTAEQGGTAHYLYVLMRDIGDDPASTRRCVIKMTVVPFTLSKLALVVDDARFAGGLSDPTHDEFLNRTILRHLRTLGQVDDFPIWSSDPEYGTSPAILRLEDVTDYQIIVWSLGYSTNLASGLGVRANQAVLSNYLKAGGRLMMFGQNIAGMNRNQLLYPLDPPDGGAGADNIYYKFLYMQNVVVSNITTVPDACSAAKSGLVTARSANPAYPDLVLDQAKRNPWDMADGEYKGGVAWEGCMAGPGQIPVPHEGLDTLYTVQTWNRSIRAQCGTDPSRVEGAVVSARYQSTAADTLEGRQHGRVVYFDFQPWWFQEDRLMDAGTAAVNWLCTGRDQ